MKNTNEVIMNILPNADKAVIPVEKFTKYVLDSEYGDKEKAKAFELALGYKLHNANDLIKNILEHIMNYPAKFKGSDQYGDKYEIIMLLVGINGKSANVKTGWIIDSKTGETRLTSAYITKKKIKEE